ncbi:hypothetical protein ABPG77_002359 [Micractinium sp. CCAP 211/92]
MPRRKASSDEEEEEPSLELSSSEDLDESLRSSSSSSSSEDEEQREWNACCEACGGFDDLGAALRCSTCPHQYHPDCLTPEQRAQRAEPDPSAGGHRGGGARAPTGWVCPRCTRRTQLGKYIDKILASRGGGAAKEYRLKWVGLSYLHTEWVKLSELEEAATAYPGLRRRLAVFEAKQKEAAQADGELVEGVKPAWLEVERVIAERAVGGLGGAAGAGGSARRAQQGEAMDAGGGEGGAAGGGDASKSHAAGAGAAGGPRRQFLCKWRELSYAECTWEDEADVAEQQDLIEQFRRRAPISELDLPLPPRPDSAAEQASPPADPLAQLAEASAELAAASPGASVQRRFAASPGFLRGELHPYQLEGLNWLYQGWETHTNLILADEMGLGKTIQAIAFLAALCHERCPRPHLVVVPLSTLPNWQREFARFAPQLNVVAFAGNAEARAVVKEFELFAHGLGARTINAADRRREMLQRAVQFHVLLTSYEMVAAEAADLSKLEFEALVVDEGHRLKNKEARLFQALQGLRLRHRTLLTGTPLQNDLSELFMLLHFLEPQRFDSLDAFEQEFRDISHEQQVERLHTLLRPHLLRRMKTDVMQQLPPKKEQIVAVELSAAQKQMYRSILTISYESLTKGGVTKLRNVMMELRKVIQHIYLQVYPPDPRPTGPAWLQLLLEGSGKLALLDRMLQKLRAGGHRVLVYSQFLLMLDVLEWYCAARGFTYLRLDGSIGTAERQRRIDAYNSQPDKHFLFLLSTRAGGLGINLATADTVILYDSDWNPHNDLQAQARAHRLGQQSGVMVYRLNARSTVEERMMQRAKGKLVLEHVVVRKLKRKSPGALGAAAGSEQPLDGNELQDLIRFGAAELFAEEGQEAAKGPGNDCSAFPLAETADTFMGGARERSLPTSVAEHQAGRTGGLDGRAIVWTDEAIDQLLDRSKLDAQPEAAEAAAGGNDILAGFKVAHFELKEAPPEHPPSGSLAADGAIAPGDSADVSAAAAGEGALPPDAAAQFSAVAFWEQLLAGRHAAARAASDIALGKGKRQRRKLLNLQAEAELDALLRGASSSSGGSDSEGGRSGRSGDTGRASGGFNGQLADEEYEIGSDEEQEQRAEEEQEAAEWEQVGLVPEERERRRRARWAAHAEPAPAAAAAAVETALGTRGPQGAAGPAAAASHQQPVLPAQQAAQQPAMRPVIKRHRRTKAEMAVEREQWKLAILLTCAGEPSWVPPGGWPLLSGSGDQLRVWGFNRLQRACFMALVMQHGVELSDDGGFDWRFLQSQFPVKDPGDVAKYGELVMDRVMTAGKAGGGATHGTAEQAGIPVDSLMCGRAAREVLQRVGMLHVLRSEFASLAQADGTQGPPPARRNLARQASPGAPCPGLRSSCGAWGLVQDVRLLQGLLEHGYGRWEDVLADAALGLQPAVLAELADMGFDSKAPSKPGPSASKQQERAYKQAMRRQAQWLEARVARLAAALAMDPRDPDPPVLCEPMRFVFYRRFAPRGLRPVDRGDDGPAAANLQQQLRQQQQALLHGLGGSSNRGGRPERKVVDDRADKVADHINGLRQLPEESRHRRLKLHQFNRHMTRLSETIDRDTQQVHAALLAGRPVNLVDAGQTFQRRLLGISSSAAQMLELLRAELQAISLWRRASDKAAAPQPGLLSQQREQQRQQQVPVHMQPPPSRPVMGILVAPALPNSEQQQQQQVPAHMQPPPPFDCQPASGKVHDIVNGTVVQGVPADEQPAPTMAPPLHTRPSVVAVDQLPPRAAQPEALKLKEESSLTPPQGQHRQPPAQRPMERQQQLLQPAAAQQPAAVIGRQQRAVAAGPSKHLPPPTVEEPRSGDALLAEILQDISGLETEATAAADSADAAGAAAAAVGIMVEAAAQPRPLSPTLAALACGGAEPGRAGGVAVVSASSGVGADGRGGGGLEAERLLREAQDVLRDILGGEGEPEALQGITVQQVHPQQGGQLPAQQAGQQAAQQDPPLPAGNASTGAGPPAHIGPAAAAAAAASPTAAASAPLAPPQ